MTKRTLVTCWRDIWSWLITGAANDKMTFSRSCEAPSKKEEKNMGQLNMANPINRDNEKNFSMANKTSNVKNQSLAANPYLSDLDMTNPIHAEFLAAVMALSSPTISEKNFEAIARLSVKNKFKDQIKLFQQIKQKRASK